MKVICIDEVSHDIIETLVKELEKSKEEVVILMGKLEDEVNTLRRIKEVEKELVMTITPRTEPFDGGINIRTKHQRKGHERPYKFHR